MRTHEAIILFDLLWGRGGRRLRSFVDRISWKLDLLLVTGMGGLSCSALLARTFQSVLITLGLLARAT
jgi:hypothetical protein